MLGGGGGGGVTICVCIIPLICVHVFVLFLLFLFTLVCVCLAHPSAIRLDLLWYMSKACVSVYPKDGLRESTYFYLKISVCVFFGVFFSSLSFSPLLLLRL